MSRSAPPKIQPIVSAGIRYEAPWSERGVLIAKDAATGQELWRLLLADYPIDATVEADAQEVYLKSLQLTSGGQIVVEDEAGARYVVDLARKTFTIRKS